MIINGKPPDTLAPHGTLTATRTQVPLRRTVSGLSVAAVRRRGAVCAVTATAAGATGHRGALGTVWQASGPHMDDDADESIAYFI